MWWEFSLKISTSASIACVAPKLYQKGSAILKSCASMLNCAFANGIDIKSKLTYKVAATEPEGCIRADHRNSSL